LLFTFLVPFEKRTYHIHFTFVERFTQKFNINIILYLYTMKFIIIPYTITPFVCGSIGYLYGYMHNIHKHQGLGNIRHTSKEFTILYGIIGTIIGGIIGFTYKAITFQT